jgi:hypothetical protein
LPRFLIHDISQSYDFIIHLKWSFFFFEGFFFKELRLKNLENHEEPKETRLKNLERFNKKYVIINFFYLGGTNWYLWFT